VSGLLDTPIPSVKNVYLLDCTDLQTQKRIPPFATSLYGVSRKLQLALTEIHGKKVGGQLKGECWEKGPQR
jgi:hypothetical protein